MAKKKGPGILASIFWTCIIIMAAQFCTLFSVLVYQVYSGKLDSQELSEMLFVLRGDHRYVIDVNGYKRYKEFLKEEEKFYKQLEIEKGSPAMQASAEGASADMVERIKQETAAARSLLANEQAKLKSLRAEVEAAKQALNSAETALDDSKKLAKEKELADKTQKLQKAIAALDPATVGNILSSILKQSGGGPVEVSRLMHEHMKAGFIAEVLEEMPEKDRQQILPILENEYAGSAPDEIVVDWKRRKLLPVEMAVYLRQMTAIKALKVLSLLNPPEKRKVEQVMLNMPR